MRALLAIGCNHYDHQQDLGSAESDATRIYEALIREGVGDYDSACSMLLLSPTLDEVRRAFRKILPSCRLETFTFHFAGHGSVHAGGFYMWLRDSTSSATSLTALSLSELFRSLSDFAPYQSNVIIDACQSGGLIADLSVLLKPELLGDAGTPGLTLVATSAQNQFAEENSLGGIGTNAILDCIEGRTLVNESRPTLDLAEIGRHIHTTMQDQDAQTPVVWGLNLFGASGFCSNPRYGADPTMRLRDALHAWPAGSDQAIRDNYDALWRVYTSASLEWNAREFAKVIAIVFQPLAAQPEALALFSERLSATTLERAKLSQDLFRVPEVAACLAACLLPFLDNGIISQQINELLKLAGSSTIDAAKALLKDLQADRYALLTRRGGGISELFILPIRVTKILGWTAAAGIFLEGCERQAEANEIFGEIVEAVLHDYASVLTLISDAQAPYIAIAISRAKALDMESAAEQVVGMFYNSYLSSQGNITACDVPSDRMLDYIQARRSGQFAAVLDVIESPGQAFTVLLRAAVLLGLEDVFDEDIWEVDGISFLAYMTPEFGQYGLERMDGGENYVWRVGLDVFQVQDLTGSWPQISNPSNSLEARAVVAASLLYPDRIPWFLLAE